MLGMSDEVKFLHNLRVSFFIFSKKARVLVVNWIALPTATSYQGPISMYVMQDGTVVSWGHGAHGGDSIAVQGQLRDVRSVHASSAAFAALRSDGSVAWWLPAIPLAS